MPFDSVKQHNMVANVEVKGAISRNEPYRVGGDELKEEVNERSGPRRNVTQKITNLVTELNKSGEILMREHNTTN